MSAGHISASMSSNSSEKELQPNSFTCANKDVQLAALLMSREPPARSISAAMKYALPDFNIFFYFSTLKQCNTNSRTKIQLSDFSVNHLFKDCRS